LFSTAAGGSPTHGGLMIVAPDATGYYEFGRILPGEYFLALVEDTAVADGVDASALHALASRALRISILKDQTVVQDWIAPGINGNGGPK
jgi:hypothetical protein